MFTNLHYWFLAESFNLSTLRIPTPVETPANLKDIDWKDLKIVEEGDNGNNIINLGIQLPGEDKPNEGAVLDIQLVNDELYQPHIFLSDALQGAGLGYKIYLKFIHEFGHIYSGDGRRQNKTQIPAIFDKLKADGNIEAHRLPHGYLFILKDNPDRNYLVNKYVNKEKKMITTIDEFCSVNESTEPRMMSFTIPDKKDWIEQGENVGIRFMGRTYWIKAVDMKFFEDNIGNTIGFKYFPNAMYIEMPSVLKQNIISKTESNEIDSQFHDDFELPSNMKYMFNTTYKNTINNDEWYWNGVNGSIDIYKNNKWFATYNYGDYETSKKAAFERIIKEIGEMNHNIVKENITQPVSGRRLYFWLSVDPRNSGQLETLLKDHFIDFDAVTDDEKNNLVDKYFDKSLSIYKIYVGKRWTSQELTWWRRDFERLISTANIIIKPLYHSMYHHKKMPQSLTTESFISESDLRNYSTLNKVQHLLKNDKITVYYFGPHDTPDTALKFDAKIVTPPYVSRGNVEAVVKSIDPTGEKYLADGIVWYKRGRWVHAGKWNARKTNKRILR